ncbi:MAG: aminotransferase class V-fold PLP-dependent enzyme [Candidatus Thorarchaeota archaeon]|nr:aminotransferase class V-fold PLP-dependent enzyme [Candidatus Thorarchaeota archaeon]
MFESVAELIEAHKGIEREVYLDLENSSPLPREIVKAMVPYFSEKAYGNPTVTHKPGWMAYEAIQKASQQIAGYVGAGSVEEINFTPGETETNNLALIGSALANKKKGHKIVTSEIEPLSIIFSSKILEKCGFKVEKVPVDEEGLVNLEKLVDAVDEETLLVSIMSVNHEIGTVEPIREAVEAVKEKNPTVLFHTDASDAYGRVPLDVDELGIDLMTLSSYKILGPRGVGALYVREGVEIERLLEGQVGTQKLWPGVENVPLIIGFSKASELAFKSFEENISRMKGFRDRLMDEILDRIPETLLNGPRGEKRVADSLNVSFLQCEGESLTIELSLKGVYVSSGSACTRLILQPSHVLTAIGREFEKAHGSILMKVTRYHTEEDIEYVLKMFPKAVRRLRGISPIRRGVD